MGYAGPLNIESFTVDNAAIAVAASIWRPLAPSQDELAESGLAFLRSLCRGRFQHDPRQSGRQPRTTPAGWPRSRPSPSRWPARPSRRPADIAAHLANTLSEANFRAYLADPDVTVLVIDADGDLRGYSLLVARPARDPDVAAALTILPSPNSASATSTRTTTGSAPRPN